MKIDFTLAAISGNFVIFNIKCNNKLKLELKRVYWTLNER